MTVDVRFVDGPMRGTTVGLTVAPPVVVVEGGEVYERIADTQGVARYVHAPGPRGQCLLSCRNELKHRHVAGCPVGEAMVRIEAHIAAEVAAEQARDRWISQPAVEEKPGWLTARWRRLFGWCTPTKRHDWSRPAEVGATAEDVIAGTGRVMYEQRCSRCGKVRGWEESNV